MKRILLAVVASILLLAGSADASILVGTFKESTVETITKINQLIDDYNTDFSASLANVLLLVDKVEGQSSAAFNQGNLELDDFDFFTQDDNGSKTVSIFDATVKFNASLLSSSVGFDNLDAPVQGFEQLSGPSFEYYVSKDGNDGWSLWASMSGFNPVYTDAGTGDSSITGSGFTRGDISNTSLAYDPIRGGVSHISFYTTAEEIIPEPASWVVFTGLFLGFGAGAWRRKRKKTA